MALHCALHHAVSMMVCTFCAIYFGLFPISVSTEAVNSDDLYIIAAQIRINSISVQIIFSAMYVVGTLGILSLLKSTYTLYQCK